MSEDVLEGWAAPHLTHTTDCRSHTAGKALCACLNVCLSLLACGCRLHFTAAKALSAVSLDQYCHLLGLCLMLVLLLFTAWATLHPHHKHTTALNWAQDAAEEPAHPHQQQQQHVGGAGVTAWVAVIVVMALVLAIVAAAQMLVRLRRHQTEVELVDDMMV